MQGCRERRRKEGSRKQVGSVPPVLDQRLSPQTPHGLAKSLLPSVGGWDSELFREGMGLGPAVTTRPTPPPPWGGGECQLTQVGTEGTPGRRYFFQATPFT
jgi:hypothetical protein